MRTKLLEQFMLHHISSLCSYLCEVHPFAKSYVSSGTSFGSSRCIACVRLVCCCCLLNLLGFVVSAHEGQTQGCQ